MNKKLNVVFKEEYVKDYDVLLANNDTLKFLNTIPEDEKIKLIVTSPPYNIGKIYEKRQKFEDYLNWQKEVIGRCKQILSDNGSICWEIGNYIENGEVFPLDAYFYDIFKDLNMKMRNRIIWRFGHGLHASKRFSGRYETIMWFTKNDNYTFNLDAVRIPIKYPGKRYYKGKNKGLPSCNPLGKNPSDIWDVMIRDWDGEVWDIPNVKSNHPEKTIHPCQFPIELIERLVLALTNEGDIVLDPFVGVGSTILAAVIHNRRAVGVDYSEEYLKIAMCRIKEYEKGKLKKRPFGKPVYRPKGTEKVARPPEEWKMKKINEF
ncbi:MAG: site-specific DNA-methyltransferase [Methanocellales archaeon]|nr:site-specific DNA-methyltransferase [Methanocellales archaeon]MDD3291944.1 site-specific DNA-methyltransferase [Methanocellales archaeon]MDD5235655.1 site-specific DNA-methyltransferase [Methanocellales archaeon]MDD5485502.1 site-specific DNA-methyltransferase [Methanocellales archaeon]